MEANGKVAAIYDRVSHQKNGHSVEDQEAANRQECETHGWPIFAVYQDPDVPASRFTRRVRDDYPRLMRDLAVGQFNVLVLWESSRGSRRLGEWVDLLDTCRERDILIHVTSHRRTYDVRVARDWRSLADDGVDSAYESEKTSDRLKRTLAAKAARGGSHGFTAWGWRREYDYDDRGNPTDVREVVEPEEAAIIRESTDRLLRGESLRTIVADLNQRGLRSPRGRDWEPVTLRQVLLRERNAGRRVHRGQVIGNGSWPPILDTDTFDRLKGLLTNPGRRTNAGAPRSKYLLSGIARCGECDGPLRVITGTAYTCPNCFKIRRSRERVDDLVTRVIVGILSKPDAMRALSAASADDVEHERVVARRDALRAKLDLAADQFAADEIDGSQLSRITAKLRPDLQRVEIDLRSQSTAPDLLDLAHPEIAAIWEDVPLERKRAVIAALLSIRVMPLGSGKRWDPRSVEITARLYKRDQ